MLECVNRLLDKSSQLQNIVLEKTLFAGHGTSDRLDILVNRDYFLSSLMVEYKTYEIELEKNYLLPLTLNKEY